MTRYFNRQKQNFIESTRKITNSTVLPSFQFGMNCHGFAAARLTWPTYIDGRKLEIALSEKIALLLHRHVDVPCSLVVT